jgi:hypothetical protein
MMKTEPLLIYRNPRPEPPLTFASVFPVECGTSK